MKREEFTGVGPLIRLALRRDRIVLPTWIVLLTLSVISTASSYTELYSTPQALHDAVSFIASNPAFTALSGPIYGSSLGSLTTWKIGIFNAVLVALMSFLAVVRHTRAEEEAGRRDLLGATVVGRHAHLTAALIVAISVNAVLAAAVTLGAIAVGLPAAGSLALGLSWVGVGLVFSGVAGITAQLTESAHTARSMAGVVLGLAYALRLIGDTSTGMGWITWLSPIGWAQHMQPFAANQWPVLGLFIGVFLPLAVAAYWLAAHRDIGAGILPQRIGPAFASPRLCSPFAVAWRLHWSSLLSWTIGFTLLGLILGSAAQSFTDLEKMLNDSPQLRSLLAALGSNANIVDMFLSAMLSIFAFVAAVYAVQSVLRLRSEEDSAHAEILLSAPVSRWRWAAGHLVFAVVGPAVLLAAIGMAIGLAYGLNVGNPSHEILRLLGSVMVQLPAVWVLTGLTMALFGLLPRFMALSWVALGLFLLVGQLGDLLGLSQAVMNLSPFTHVPKLPGGELVFAPLAWLTLVSAALTAVGLIGLRRRDV